ncbi:hypothetical protein BKP64_05735 [Marinobacter salinus]|uniref:Uncharacterized protein n=1 Tax=Marinobacter salinus TaxID=1874317 RepID=A0A1D9GJ93_9GAMM|nr:hypothetical protein [Marinobacter salinus]AOY87712.1 hypothetical protein BKP64_05735 [Marinobacter salinus]
MPFPQQPPLGDETREAIDSLRGYAYQIYQSALAWTDIDFDEFLYLEVAEDYAVAAADALKAVQVKDTTGTVTINTDGIIASIDSFVDLVERNPGINVSLRHLTTSRIGKEKKAEHRVDNRATLESWRSLAKVGDLSELRKVLRNSKLADKTKRYIAALDDTGLRENFLQRIHFDCGAPDSPFLKRQIESRILKLVLEKGGLASDVPDCIAGILLSILELSAARNPSERFVTRADLEEHLERATQITLNRAQFESQNLRVAKALSRSLSSENGLSGEANLKPSPVSEVPLPIALAKRDRYLTKMLSCLERSGSCWITGAAGMGKTVAARILAHEVGGEWGSVNLRGLAKEQTAIALLDLANALSEYGLRGLIIDDLEHTLNPSVLDNLNYLFFSAGRSDVLLIITAPNGPSSDFLFASGLQAEIAVVLAEFSRKDLTEILEKLEVPSASEWANYTHLISGGGHPQLAMAFIQSMCARGWDSSELQTLNSLIEESPAIAEVRRRTRERLLQDLPESSRRLIERLSLKVGGFRRGLVLDLGKITPPIHDTGIIFDRLIGSWIDQHEADRFSLSPLLTNYAASSLTDGDKKVIHSAIAESLTSGKTLDVIDLNAAFFSARSSNNKSVVVKLCLFLLNSEDEKLQRLAPHLSVFTLLRTDVEPYPGDPLTSQMLRGVQLLLLSQENEPQKLEKALNRFFVEEKNVQNVMMRKFLNLVIYSKLLLQHSNSVLGSNFLDLIQELRQILQNEDGGLPEEVMESLQEISIKEGCDITSFMFVNQTRQLSRIFDLVTVFDFLDNSSIKTRSNLLKPFDRDDFSIDTLVAGAWLSEHENGTIEPQVHSDTFASLEAKAAGWGRNDLSVCCRKYRAIILDEYGNDKDSALAILNEGLAIYGQTNSELVRAKAKVLYRSEDHEGSLALSKRLIENDTQLSEVEKAFLGRDAAISAEKQGDYQTAQKYYLFGSEAAGKSGLPDMEAMRIGLLADAGLANWHDGEKSICLKYFIEVLKELPQLDTNITTRTAHCHAVSRHVLMWLAQDAAGEPHQFGEGEETKIYPGIVSNPEPNKEISERRLLPIEYAWYMLAKIENYASINVGVTKNLEAYLPNGPLIQGQLLLVPGLRHNALNQLDAKLFVYALRSTISSFAHANTLLRQAREISLVNFDYGTLPLATEPEQKEHRNISEQLLLLYFSFSLMNENVSAVEELLRALPNSSGFEIRSDLLNAIQGKGVAFDYETSFGNLIFEQARAIRGFQSISPTQTFEISLKTLQIAKPYGHFQLACEVLLPWLNRRWAFITQNQRSMLTKLTLHEGLISQELTNSEASTSARVINFLSALLPTLGLNSSRELLEILTSLRAQ